MRWGFRVAGVRLLERNWPGPQAGICVLTFPSTGTILPASSAYNTPCLRTGRNSAEARQEHAGLFGVFGEAFAKFFGQESLFAFCFAVKGKEREYKTEECSYLTLQH